VIIFNYIIDSLWISITVKENIV